MSFIGPRTRPPLDSPDTTLCMWTVYRHPADYPDAWVVRRWRVRGERKPAAAEPDAKPWAVARSLEDARQTIPKGLVCLNRTPEDDPVVVETWL